MPTAKVKKNPKHEEKKLISNEYYECKYVADKFAIPVWRVYFYKHILGSNNRAEIYAEIQKKEFAVTPV